MYANRITIILLTFVTVQCLAQSQDQKELTAGEIMRSCQAKYGVSDELLNEILNFQGISDHPDVKCMTGCWVVALKLVKDNKLDLNEVKEFVNKTFLIDHQEKAQSILESCVEHASNDNQCEMGYNLSLCFIDFAKEINLNGDHFEPN